MLFKSMQRLNIILTFHFLIKLVSVASFSIKLILLLILYDCYYLQGTRPSYIPLITIKLNDLDGNRLILLCNILRLILIQWLIHVELCFFCIQGVYDSHHMLFCYFSVKFHQKNYWLILYLTRFLALLTNI
jgi:hypothetical protein